MSEHPPEHPDLGPGETSRSEVDAVRSERKIPLTALVFVLAAVAALVVAMGVRHSGPWAGSPEGRAPADGSLAMPLPPPSPLVADHATHAFGTVPVDGGPVETTFRLTNIGGDSARIVAAYTSCACATARLRFPDGTTAGPFGVPDPNQPLMLDRSLAAGDSVSVTVRFDPTIPGPDGLGPVERQVTIHSADGAAATVSFTADVVKAPAK